MLTQITRETHHLAELLRGEDHRSRFCLNEQGVRSDEWSTVESAKCMEQLAHGYIYPTCHRIQEKICKIDLPGWGQAFGMFFGLIISSLGHDQN